MEPTTWHGMDTAAALAKINSDAKSGLQEEEVHRRLILYGPNALQEPPPRSLLSLFLGQLRETLVLILLAAAFVSGLLNQWKDSLIILVIVIINSVLGVIQEHKAEEALKALKEMAKPKAKVIRSGKITQINANSLVPGDVILLEAGDYVPADARLLTAAALYVNESALTGESLPVEKNPEALRGSKIPLGDRMNMLYMGTTVTNGNGRAVVVETGTTTELGKIAQLLETAPPDPTPLEQRMDELGKYLGAAVLFIVVIVFLTGLWQGEEILGMFMTAVSLAVAAVPEGLPTVVTIVLALGVTKMSRHQAVIRKLPAVETLGTTTVICSDKTGTLTKNEMTVTQLYLPGRLFTPEDVAAGEQPPYYLLLGGLLNSNAVLEKNHKGYQIIGDPTEGALVLAAAHYRLDWEKIKEDHPRLAQIPFDSKRKLMTGFYSIAGEIRSFTTGAPDVILERCTKVYTGEGKETEPLTERAKERFLAVNSQLASQGQRVLALATKTWQQIPDKSSLETAEEELVYIGFFALQDPPRSEAKNAVAISRRAGIRTIMITGDHPQTALAIAKSLDIYREGDGVLTGLQLEQLTDEGLLQAVKNTTVYARVSPEHKLRIVEALKKHQHVVAMTGDGVNDAPALKRADIGVAMGITGTEVAKQAADMVLLDDNFATIVNAVAEGRRIYNNIRKTIHYLLSCNTGEIVTIFFALLLGLGSPLTPIQILWINLVTDGPPALALGLDPAEKHTMDKPPRKRQEGIFAQGLGLKMLRQGMLIGLLTLGSYWLALQWDRTPVEASTLAFMIMAMQQLIHSFNVRSLEDSLFTLGLTSNPALIYAFLVSTFLQMAVVVTPFFQDIFGTTTLLAGDWALIFGVSLIPLLLEEIRKLAAKN